VQKSMTLNDLEWSIRICSHWLIVNVIYHRSASCPIVKVSPRKFILHEKWCRQVELRVSAERCRIIEVNRSPDSETRQYGDVVLKTTTSRPAVGARWFDTWRSGRVVCKALDKATGYSTRRLSTTDKLFRRAQMLRNIADRFSDIQCNDSNVTAKRVRRCLYIRNSVWHPS